GRGGDEATRRCVRQELERDRGTFHLGSPAPPVRALLDPAAPVVLGLEVQTDDLALAEGHGRGRGARVEDEPGVLPGANGEPRPDIVAVALERRQARENQALLPR